MEDRLGRASHPDRSVGPIPLDFQGATGQVQAGPPFGQAKQVAGHQGGAGAGAAGQGWPRPPLPDPHAQVVGAEDLDEMHVGAGRECFVLLQQGPQGFEINGIEIGHRNHHMGIAHAGGGHGQGLIRHHQDALGQTSWSHRQGGGDGFGAQAGRAHVHPHAAIGLELGNDGARQGLDQPAAARSIAIAVGQKPGQATDAVTAHLRFAAIGIEDAHAQLTPLAGRQSQY